VTVKAGQASKSQRHPLPGAVQAFYAVPDYPIVHQMRFHQNFNAFSLAQISFLSKLKCNTFLQERKEERAVSHAQNENPECDGTGEL